METQMRDFEHEQTEEKMENTAKALRERLDSGKATPSDAERLADIERKLKRMAAIRRGQAW